LLLFSREAAAAANQDIRVIMDWSLTICSVSFRSASYLKLNRSLTAALNPQATWKWVVVENTPEHSGDKIEGRDGFIVLDGIPQTFAGPASGSYHHGTALNKTLAQIQTRFALFLDPDFYIVRPNWMREVIAHMLENDLAFFGAPWHPRWVQKYRYFPCVHCMFVDLEKVDISDFDFTPGFPQSLREPDSPPAATAQQSPGLIQQALSAMRKTLRNLKLFSMRGVVTAYDTGFHIYDRYHVKKQSVSECVVPVFNLKNDYIGPYLPVSLFGRIVSRAIPDNLSFIPTRPGYYTDDGFDRHGYPNIAGKGWEEFMWKGRPFGFHLRGQAPVGRKEHEKETVGQIIEKFIGQNSEGAADSRV
jgi:hypothetical protein